MFVTRDRNLKTYIEILLFIYLTSVQFIRMSKHVQNIQIVYSTAHSLCILYCIEYEKLSFTVCQSSVLENKNVLFLFPVFFFAVKGQ